MKTREKNGTMNTIPPIGLTATIATHLMSLTTMFSRIKAEPITKLLPQVLPGRGKEIISSRKSYWSSSIPSKELQLVQNIRYRSNHESKKHLLDLRRQ